MATSSCVKLLIRMRKLTTFVFCTYVVLLLSSLRISVHSEQFEPNDFTNEWAARIYGGPEVANDVAQQYGYENAGKLLGIDDTYLLRKLDFPKRALYDALIHTQELNDDHRVEFADHQRIKIREKRDMSQYWKEVEKEMSFNESCTSHRFNDPAWRKEWYICDQRSNPNVTAINLHIDGVWRSGITGKGIIVCIPDDGLEWNNTDIYANYDPMASYDINGNDSDPFPRYTSPEKNGHGTRCAGEIAMVANNSFCGVGVAYNAKIGGVRILDGPITDSMEAMAIGFNCTYIDIYSASWGPPDNGKALDGPDRFTFEAMERCIQKGRGGKGVIYMWASGNGGYHNDNCNCDGYVNSIYTVPIGGVEPEGKFPSYGEMCSSVIACAYSGEILENQQIVTTGLHNTCANGHLGTSAAAPLAAGIVALMLEANGELTWRDVQHIITWTSDNSYLLNNPGWQTNAIGLSFNIRFGFGLLHAQRAVRLAKKWKQVPPAFKCKVFMQNIDSNQELKSNSSVKVTFNATACSGCTGTQRINYMEHVQVALNVSYTRRGAISVSLKSPMGTESTMLRGRKYDEDSSGLNNWVLMTRQTWGESPSGIWTLSVSDETLEENTGMVNGALLTIHGTSENPTHETTLETTVEVC